MNEKPGNWMKVQPDDPSYRVKAEREAEYWAHPPLTVDALETKLTDRVRRFFNERFTGAPDKTWLDDVISRGPYRNAAVLGCTEGSCESAWLEANASEHLDVYELSKAVLDKARAQFSARDFEVSWQDRVRFKQADLNFVRLPHNRYDVVWTKGCVHHLINLEYLFREVEASLTERGLFVLHDYVGEKRLDYHPERMKLANTALSQVPKRFRTNGIEALGPPPEIDRSPFEAIRSNETLAIAQSLFDIVHLGTAHALFPLLYLLELETLEQEAPDLIERVLTADDQASQHPDIHPCYVYAVFRKRLDVNSNGNY